MGMRISNTSFPIRMIFILMLMAIVCLQRQIEKLHASLEKKRCVYRMIRI